MADMVRLGAYRSGTDPAVDEALRQTPLIDHFLRQSKADRTGFEDSFERLGRVFLDRSGQDALGGWYERTA